MHEGEVDGYHDVECPLCGLNNWEVRVEHSYDGPAVNLTCATVEWPNQLEKECRFSVRIDIQQKLVLF